MIKLFLYLFPIILIYLPDLYVKNIFKKNNKILNDMPFSGKELADKILKDFKLENIPINSIKNIPIGNSNYDPIKKEINISESIYNRKSITSLAVIVHEIGHAIQHKEKSKLLDLRIKLIKKTKILQNVGSVLFIIGLPSIFTVTKSFLLTIITGLIIIGCLSTNVLVHLITLPNETDASFNKALPILKKYVPRENLKQCRSVLIAAAFTYLAGSVRSILQLRVILFSFFNIFKSMIRR